MKGAVSIAINGTPRPRLVSVFRTPKAIQEYQTTGARMSDVENSSNAALVPLVLRIADLRAANAIDSCAHLDEDALPTVLGLDEDGCVVSRGTKVTEIKSETTDDT